MPEFAHQVTEFVVVVYVGIKNGPAWTRDNSPKAANENSIRIACAFWERLRESGLNNFGNASFPFRLFAHSPFSLTSFRRRSPGTTACGRLRHPRGYGCTMRNTVPRSVGNEVLSELEPASREGRATAASLHRVTLSGPPALPGARREGGKEGEMQDAAIQVLPSFLPSPAPLPPPHRISSLSPGRGVAWRCAL